MVKVLFTVEKLCTCILSFIVVFKAKKKWPWRAIIAYLLNSYQKYLENSSLEGPFFKAKKKNSELV